MKRLRPEQRDKLQRKLQSREYRRADVIYHPDDEAGSLYVVLAGVVRGARIQAIARGPVELDVA